MIYYITLLNTLKVLWYMPTIQCRERAQRSARVLHLGNVFQFGSVQFSHSVMSDSLWPHESQHTRPPCPSPTPGVYSNPCASSQWCHPAISSSVVPFSSCPQSLPAIRVFSNESTLHMRWPKYWSIGLNWTDRLPSMGWHRVGQDWSDLAAAAVELNWMVTLFVNMYFLKYSLYTCPS